MLWAPCLFSFMMKLQPLWHVSCSSSLRRPKREGVGMPLAVCLGRCRRYTTLKLRHHLWRVASMECSWAWGNYETLLKSIIQEQRVMSTGGILCNCNFDGHQNCFWLERKKKKLHRQWKGSTPNIDWGKGVNWGPGTECPPKQWSKLQKPIGIRTMTSNISNVLLRGSLSWPSSWWWFVANVVTV